MPDVINRCLDRDDLYNYSFNIAMSPYGPIYLNSIKKKLKNSTSGNIFILAVDPWSISSKSDDPDDERRFRENKLALGLVSNPNIHPNIEYLTRCYSEPFVEIIKGKFEVPLFNVHRNGWLELNISMDQKTVWKRTKNKIERYEKVNLPAYKYSELRYAYLSQTIRYLQGFGSVYLVRLPVCTEILDIEHEVMPNFQSRIQALSNEEGAPYFDLTNNPAHYSYTNGNHLAKTSAREVSMLVGNWIANIAPPKGRDISQCEF